MSGRSPAYLAEVPVERVKGVGDRLAGKLREAGISCVTDLLFHFPRRHIDRSLTTSIAEVPVGREVTVLGTVSEVSARRARRGLSIVEIAVFDGSSYMWATFFNQPFRERQLGEGTEVALSGKVERYRGRVQMKSPVVDVLGKASHRRTGRIVPVYPSVAGIASWRMEQFAANALRRSRPVQDPLPAETVSSLGLVGRDQAIAGMHFPEDQEDADRARRRLVFDELFRLEVALAMRKHRQVEEAEGITHVVDAELVGSFFDSLPFLLTGAQRRAVDEIQADTVIAPDRSRLVSWGTSICRSNPSRSTSSNCKPLSIFPAA